MKSKQTTANAAPEKTKPAPATAPKSAPVRGTASMFDRENFLWMLGGAVLIIIGFFVMSGGRSDNPNVFDPKEVYSPVRITVAPILILAGLVVEIFAVFRTQKEK